MCLLEAFFIGATKMPMNMAAIENKTGIKSAGAIILLMILTPPNTMKQIRIVTMTP